MTSILNSALGLLFLIMPISFILGNAITNGISALIILLGLIKFKKTIFYFKKDLLIYFLLIFFLLIILSSLINYSITDEKFIRSIIFLKYFLFTIVIKKIIEEKIVNIKHFIFVAASASLIVSSSVIIEWIIDFRIDEFLLYGDAYQKCSGKVLSTGILDLTESCLKNNWEVYKSRSLKRFNSGIFFGENIAGGFITRFSLFALFLLFYLKNIKNYNFKDYLIFFLILFICQLSSLVTGNRMSFILFLMMNFLYFFVYEINKKKLIIFFISISIVFSIMVSDKNLRNQYLSFFDNSKFLVSNFNKFVVKDTTKEEKLNPDYKQHGSSHKYLFKTSIQIWKDNKFFGTGFKSFRIKCNDVHERSVYGACSNHPHNYYIELLSELGLFSVVILLMIILTIIYRYIKYFGKNYYKEKNINELFYAVIFINFLVEIFPVKSSGSFLSTGNSAYIFLLIGILISNSLLSKSKI